MGPDRAQENAIRHYKGPCMVLAGPGSGKTYTIARRVQYLIQHCKVRPEEILVITFTRASSREMEERFRKLTDGGNTAVTFGTFHGVYFRILRWAYRLEARNILTEEEKYQLIRRIILSAEAGYEPEISDEQEEIRELITEIGNVKSSGMDAGEYESARGKTLFRRVYQAYESQRKAMRKIDFDDMLLLCRDLFVRRPDILAQWQKRFRFILIDEFQDVNRIQYEVIRMLAMPENNLFVVGDDDQSIYHFRGSSPEIMLGFEKDYPDARRFLLNMNYRSSANIVNGGLEVIRHNRSRFEKTLSAGRPGGSLVHVQEVKDPREESLYLIRRLKEFAEKHIAPEQTAVLYRTENDARILTETLIEHQIPFQIKGRIQNIYDHFVSRILISYIRLAEGERDRELFLNVINVPNRYISRESLEGPRPSFEDIRRFYLDKSWMADRIDQMEWEIRMLEGQTPYAAIQYIRRHIGYDDYLKEYAESRKISEEDLFGILAEVEGKAREFATLKEWLSYIEEYREAFRRRKQEAGEKGGIRLMTIHGAKGLEFDAVFIIQSNEGVLPHKKAVLEEEIEEERRLFYVAMTRARKELVISYGKAKNGKEMSPSRFVRELLRLQ